MDCISSHVHQSSPFRQQDKKANPREHNVLSLADQGLVTLGLRTCGTERHHCVPSSSVKKEVKQKSVHSQCIVT